MIRTNHLHKYYNKGKSNEIHVINDTSISLPDTGLICILGESGSGKTTLLNTLGGLDDYAEGTVTIADETMSRYSQKKIDNIRTKYFAYVFQNYYLLSEHTVDYNIRLLLNMYDMSEEEKTRRIDYVLEAVDMLKYKKRLVSQLSGGQQQRVAIARALAKTPKVIFADEPTGNLDETNTMRVMQILKKISKNCLVIMVTHETRLADVFADRIIRVDSGKVVTDTTSKQNENYQYEDDSTIYLKEYNCTELFEDTITVLQYQKETSDGRQKAPLTIRVVEEEGRYYIQATSDAQVILIQSNSKKQMLNETKPVISEQEKGEYSFELEPLEWKRMPKLSMREMIRVAMRNLSVMGKQQLFLVVSFVAMAILFVIAVSDILTLNNIDIQSVIHTDSHYLKIEVEKNGGYDTLLYNEYFSELYSDYLEKTEVEYIQYVTETDLYFYYDGFEQIEDVKGLLTGYSIAPLSDLSEKQLIAGRMPAKPNEIVVDTWVLENFIKKEASIAQIFPKAEDYIGKELSVERKDWKLKIVGISDTGNPDIFMDRFTSLSITSRVTNQMASAELLQNAYPSEYADLSLEKNEVLVSESYLEHLKEIDGSTDYVSTVGTGFYQVAGTYSDEFGAIMVLSNEAYDEILNYLIVESKSFIVSTEDKQATKDYFASLPESVTERLQIFITDSYAEELAEYEEARTVKVDARLIITVTIFVVSMVLLYFSMKSNAMKKIESIMVYRFIGIKKSSILMIFAIESGLLTCYTSIPAVLLTSIVLKFIASIPSLELTLVYPWGATAVVGLFLLAINTITGILPIVSFVRKPPAQLQN